MGARLEIRRLSATARVAGDPARLPAYESLLARVSRVDLPAACGRFLEGAVQADDPSVWRIRRLELDLEVALDGLDEQELARQWGRLLADAILRALRKAPASNVVRFESRAHLLASYCADAVAGFASGAWFYEEFTGLAAMPAEMAIVAALDRDPELIAATLLILAERCQLDRVARAIGRKGALRLLRAACGQAGEPLAVGSHVISDIIAARPAGVAAEAPLQWLAAALAHSPALDPTEAAAVIQELTETPERAHEFLAAHAQSVEEAETWTKALERRVEVVRAFEQSAETVEEFASAWAGVFLLLPAYEAAACDDALPEEGRAWFRTEVLAACMGAAEAPDDAALMLAGGWSWRDGDPPEPPPAWDVLRDELAERTLRRFAKGLIGFGESSSIHLRDNFLTGGGRLRIDDDSISVLLPSVPLQLVLRIAGWHGREYEASWLAPRLVRIQLDGG